MDTSEELRWWVTWEELQKIYKKYEVEAVFHEGLFRWKEKCWHVVIKKREAEDLFKFDLNQQNRSQ